MNPLLMAFYGDDFTGSADAMEALTINGVRTALFLGHPTEERLSEDLRRPRWRMTEQPVQRGRDIAGKGGGSGVCHEVGPEPRG